MLNMLEYHTCIASFGVEAMKFAWSILNSQNCTGKHILEDIKILLVNSRKANVPMVVRSWFQILHIGISLHLY